MIPLLWMKLILNLQRRGINSLVYLLSRPLSSSIRHVKSTTHLSIMSLYLYGFQLLVLQVISLSVLY